MSRAPAPRGRRHPPSRGQPPPSALPATIALGAVTLTVAGGMARLFSGTRFLPPVMAAVLVGHGLAYAGRRLRLGTASSLALSGLGLALAVVWVVVPHSTVYGMPWSGTLHALGAATSQARHDFAQLTAPAPATGGLLLVAMGSLGMAATLADWAAFRTGGTLEALIPSFTIVLFTAALGQPGGRALAMAGYVAALMVFVVVHEADKARVATAWFTSRTLPGAAALARGALVLGATALVAASLIGPHLPGAGAAPLLDWHHHDRAQPNPRVTVNPLVDIRDRLVRQANVEVLSVASSEPAYWRLTSLDSFDGNVWSSSDAYQPVPGTRLPAVSTSAPSDAVVQDFHVSNLASAWLPAAYQPVQLSGVAGTSYNSGSGSIIGSSPTSDGLTYQVTSSVPRLTPAILASTGNGPPSFHPASFLALPTDVPPVVGRLARAAVAGQTTAYGKALALQRFFRGGSFKYSTQVPPGHSDSALVSFLTQTRTGYCEQFAAAYAVMARMVGLPSRVAVGFTQGDLGADGRYHVLGLDAHAWPEVHIGSAGWVSFEPTPGRGQPGAQDYTGVAPAQASPPAPAPSTTVANRAVPAGGPAPLTPRSNPQSRRPPVARSGAAPGHLAGHLLLALGLALVLVAAIGTVPVAKRLRRWYRRHSVVSGAERVLVAWNEAAEALAMVGATRRPAETFEEHAARASLVGRLDGEPSRALDLLARNAGAASYGPDAVPEAAVEASVAAAADVETALRARASVPQRLRWMLSAGPLVGGPGRGQSIRGRLRRDRVTPGA